jgi:phosphate-selective porin OprO/OprP
MCLLGSAFFSLPLFPQTAAKPAEREPTLKIGGLVQGQLEAGDRGDSRFADDNDRIYLRRARLNAVGRFLEDFDFKLELDLAGSLGNTSGLRAQLTDGYVNWNRYPFANVRVGQFKTPFGFEQLYTDARLITAEHSAANDRLTLSRQLGAQVGGELFERRVSYSVGLFNGTGANNNFNDNDDFLLAARASAVAFKAKLGGKDASWSAAVNGFRSEDRGL